MTCQSILKLTETSERACNLHSSEDFTLPQFREVENRQVGNVPPTPTKGLQDLVSVNKTT